MELDYQAMFGDENEKPLDRMPDNGGYVGILRTIGVIGDSLSAGEMQGTTPEGTPTYHDMDEYSWGQFMARMTGTYVYNFSRGGMTAREFANSYGNYRGYLDQQKFCRAYIMALGVNDILNQHWDIGTVDDIKNDDEKSFPMSFAVYYGRIIKAIRIKHPETRFFFVTMPRGNDANDALKEKHAALLYDIAAYFPHCFVIDLFRYGAAHDETFKKYFYLGGHLSAAGYLFTARQMVSYIDYLIRHNVEEFRQVAFLGTPFSHSGYPIL